MPATSKLLTCMPQDRMFFCTPWMYRRISGFMLLLPILHIRPSGPRSFPFRIEALIDGTPRGVLRPQLQANCSVHRRHARLATPMNRTHMSVQHYKPTIAVHHRKCEVACLHPDRSGCYQRLDSLPLTAAASEQQPTVNSSIRTQTNKISNCSPFSRHRMP